MNKAKMFLSMSLCLSLFFAQSVVAKDSAVTVEDTLRYAFSYSPNLKSAQESRQGAVHDVRAAKAGYYPTIGIWAGAGVIQDDNVSTRAAGADQEVALTGNVGLNISQTLWQGGATSASVRARKEDLNYRAWQLMDSANSLAYSAISAHADVLRRRELVELSKQNVAENKKILNLIATRQRQGLSSVGDVDLVKGRVARAQASLDLHTQGLEAALFAYTKITGQFVPKNLAPVVLPKHVYTNEDEARNVSVNKNTRIQASLAAIRSALAEKDYAGSNFAPRLSLDAGPSYTDVDYNDGTNYQWTWSAMLNMRWEIYSGGRDSANYKSKAAKVRELRQDLYATMDEVNEELRTAFSFTKSSKNQSLNYSAAAKSAKKARDNFNKQFQVGQKDLLSVLDAEGEYYFSAVEREVTKTDSVLGSYRILGISGELLNELGINQSELEITTTTKENSKFNYFQTSTLDESEALSGSTLTK